MRERLASVAKLFIGIWLGGVVVAMFLLVPQYEGLGNAGRIIIMHVPTAWVCVLAFTISAIYSALYLWKNKPEFDNRALAAAENGFLFTILATVTGMIFSQVVWGIFWNWDPRQTSIFVLLLIYAALFALRSAIEDLERRRRLSAVYSLFAFVTVPFLIFIAPRMAESTLHPNCAFIEGSECEGIELAVGKIGLLGDRKVQLLGLSQDGDVVTAEVKVSEPGLTSEAILHPTWSASEGHQIVSPEFPNLRYRLTIMSADMASQSAKLNIMAPGTGILDNRITLYTFLAGIFGFTALFIWMFRVRSKLLDIQEDLQQREGAFA
jgi:ABC-type transport system involved in cytochrome c biogenesis, permease component